MVDKQSENQIQGFAGLDMEDVKSAVGAVVGSSDDVAGAVRFVAEHGDDVVDFVQRLPELLASTASALSEAADDVAGAASFLTGSPGKSDGVKAVAEVAGEALDTCREELASAQKLLASVSQQFAKLPIPDGGIGERIGDAAERFDRVGDRLAEVATQLRKMGVSVDNAGHGLARTAGKLEKGGEALGRFSS